MAEAINYTPPPTIRDFIKDYRPGQLFYDWIVGPVGSGKTTGIFFKLAYMAKLQKPGPDGVRRTRAVIVRNTLPQLRDTTLSSWNYWFKDGQAGTWHATKNQFTLRFGDVECEVLFRPLDTADDVARVLSLEVTFAIIDEFVQIPRQIVDALSARLGRYPAAKDGGATNWGMWGSSNPDTEDNWWFDYLHDKAIVRAISPSTVLTDDDAAEMKAMLDDDGLDKRNVTYFLQPSGLGPAAENIENLPGKRAYYVNQAKGKSHAWVKQFLEAEWGFSAAGQPVAASFRADLHVAKSRLLFNEHLPLIIGLDPGLGGSALILAQQGLDGRINVLNELVQSGMGAERIIRERLQPLLRNFYPDAQVIIAPDPAAKNRAQTDEKAVIDAFAKYWPIKAETNNRLPLRLDAIEYYLTDLIQGEPTLRIDPQCRQLIRALNGGWRYAIDIKKDQIKGAEPEKNAHSHVGDAFGYMCRYFHRQTEREMRYSAAPGSKKFAPPRSFGANYHFR